MYVGQFLAVSVLEWLCFQVVIIQGRRLGLDFGQCFNVSVPILEEEWGWVWGLSQLVKTKSVFIKRGDRTGSAPFQTGTFFCTKVIINAQLILIQGHYGWMISELGFLDFVFKRQGNCLFCMIKCRLFIGLCAR